MCICLVFGPALWGQVSVVLKNNKGEVIKNLKNDSVKSKKHRGAASVDLSSALAESVAKTKTAGQKMRPAEMQKGRRIKKNKPKVIAVPKETIEVPDGVEWGHNLKNQEEQAQEIEKQVGKDLPKPGED
jgi:hypothetical protein